MDQSTIVEAIHAVSKHLTVDNVTVTNCKLIGEEHIHPKEEDNMGSDGKW